MIRRIRNAIYNLYIRLISSIAFIPSIISIGFFALALISISWFDKEALLKLHDDYPGLIIDNADTARAVLTAFIGGIISLTSFSFSMVMLLLSQASSNFSPRLLPSLISDTRNQAILGFFLGAIIFMVIVLISILPTDDDKTTSGFSVLLAIIFGLICLGLFVYFIHIMSTAIQIDNILKGVYESSKERIKEQIEKEIVNVPISDDEGDGWFGISTEQSGYFQGINLSGVLQKIQQEEVNIKLLSFKGSYVYPSTEILLFDRDISDDKKNDIFKYIIFSNNHNASENYVLGIRQITEVGVKAMSPGINDPGTAIVSIDYLTHLLELRMQLGDTEVHKSENEKYSIEIGTISFEDIIYDSLAAYRQYCKHDYVVMKKIVGMVNYLLHCETKNEKYKEVLHDQLSILKKDIESSIENEQDRNKLIDELPLS